MREEDDDTDLGKEKDDVARTNPPKEGWPEDDSYADFADDHRDVQPIEDLGSNLGHDKHQGQVEEESAEVDAFHGSGEEGEHGIQARSQLCRDDVGGVYGVSLHVDEAQRERADLTHVDLHPRSREVPS